MQIKIEHLTVVLNNYKLLDDINLTIHPNQQWAIVGESGSGKTTLGKAIAKLIFHHGDVSIKNKVEEKSKIIFVEQQHQFKNKQNISQFYHQQRFNSFDTENSLTVAEILGKKLTKTNTDWLSLFRINHLLEKPIIQLSNGENKRLQLVKAITDDPTLLILDNPFVGLDADGRTLLKTMLDQLVEKGKNILLICDEKDFPDSITHVAKLHKGKLSAHGPRSSLIDNAFPSATEHNNIHNIELSKQFQMTGYDFENAVELIDVSIRYNQVTILNEINWKVIKGEKWCVSGPNGSGKSTLLSLITADNPQAFANKIWLFDKRKGSGESIWDIKKKIGHVSPELHLFFEKDIEVKDVVASGLFDTIGLFRKPSPGDEATIDNWMSITGIIEHKLKRLHQLSLGEQRLVMLTRALVKSPPLLILDEPCQGLDTKQTNTIKSIIDKIATLEKVTLIYVSHYQDEIPQSINKFLHLENGKIKMMT